jgi:transcriptional regulator of arginine metabolism
MSVRTVPESVAARRARIAALICEQAVKSQDDLGRLLAEDGIVVTQATLSRDLDAIGAVKRPDDSGGTRYQVPEQEKWDTSLPVGDAGLPRILNETLLKAEAAQNIAVLHTPPGAAQYLAGHVDRSGLFVSVGSVAGDDTIIIVMRDGVEAQRLCDTLLDLSEKG